MVNDDIQRSICQLALDGHSLRSIALQVGVSRADVTRVVDEAGVARRAGPQRIDPERRAAIQMLAREASPSELCREFGIGRECARRIAAEVGIRRRPGQPVLYQVRHDAFSGALTPSALYFLGLLCADGCLASTRYSKLVMLQQSGDAMAQVEKFRAFLGAEHPIKEIPNSNGKPCARLNVTSAQLFHDLAGLGLHPRKTWRDDEIAQQAATSWAFWLGMLDGDGWIGFLRHGAPRVTFTGTRRLMTQLKSHLAAHGIELTPGVAYRRQDGTPLLWHVIGTGRTARRIVQLMYEAVPSDLPLERKRRRALSAMEWRTDSERS